MRLRRRQRHREFIVQAAVRVAEHLILVHDEQRWPIAFDQPALLSFERGDEDRRVEIFGEIAGSDADVPAARAPFGEFVIRQRASRHGVDRLAVILPLVRP